MSSVPDAEVLLAIDVGTINTRVSLFDVVDGRYRLIATSRVPSTAGPPLFDFSEGIRTAMAEVQNITGRTLLDDADTLIIPTTGFGEGVDLCVGSVSAGPKVRTILAALMPGISLASARHLADASLLEVVGEMTPVDGHFKEKQIDLIVAERPDLVLLVGGVDHGARDPLLELIEVIHLGIGLLPEDQRPRLIYAGNQNLAATVVERFADRSPVSLIPNIRPSLESEVLNLARLRLAEALFDIRSAQVAGYQELKIWTGDTLIPTGEAFGRLVRYLGKIYEPDKGVLGLDLGASQVTIAASFADSSTLSVNPRLGAGIPVPGLLEEGGLAKISRWLPVEISDSEIRDYIYNKAHYPATIPTEKKGLHLEYAIARENIRQALFAARQAWPDGKGEAGALLLPPIEPILAGGATLARSPHPGYAALVLLDSLQPTGISTLVLDPYGLAPALGAAASSLPMATVQLIEAGVFVSLGTVISPIGKGRVGRKVLSYKLEPEHDAPGSKGQVNFGQIVSLPLGPGEFGQLTLEPERGFDIGLGAPGRMGVFRVSGGAVGLIIDARGRPLHLFEDEDRQHEMNAKWLWNLGVSP